MKKLFISLGALANVMSATAQELAGELPQLREETVFTNADLPKSLDQIQVRPPVFESKEKSVFGAVALSYLAPGLGHVYLEDYSTAGSLLASSSIEYALGNVYNHHISYELENLNAAAYFNTCLYGVYATYRDARAYNGNRGYVYKMPSDTFSDLVYAPFNPKILSKTEVWGGLLIDLAAAFTAGYLMANVNRSAAQVARAMHPSTFAALPIGIGEESFFRGYLLPVCSELTNATGGLAISSTLFGAAHIPNARAFEEGERWRYYSFGLPLITAGGLYYGWLVQKNNSLQEVVALHAWYDFVLFSLEYMTMGEEALSEPTGISLSIPF